MVKKTIKLSSSPTSITVLEEYLQDLLLENQHCASKFPDILISLTEAVNNAIIHGNKSDASKEVQVNCKSSKTGIFIINALADKVAYKNNGSTVEIYFNLA